MPARYDVRVRVRCPARRDARPVLNSIVLISMVFILLFWFACVGALTAGPPPDDARPLFQMVPDVRDESIEKVEGVVRSRIVRMDRSLIGLLGDSRRRTLILNLFDDVDVRVTFTRSMPGRFGSEIWIGATDPDRPPNVILVVAEGVAMGTINVPELGLFQILPLDEGLVSLRELDPDAYREWCGVGDDSVNRPDIEPRGEPDYEDGIMPRDHSYPVIDVLIVYPRNGLPPGDFQHYRMHLVADGVMSAANSCFENTGLPVRLRLVSIACIDYGPVGGDMEAALDHYFNIGDDSRRLLSLRRAMGADIASIILWGGDEERCGIGMVPPEEVTDDSSFGLNVLSLGCALNWHTFAHEVGHNLGCGHAVGDKQPEGRFDYSHGYRYDDEDYRTIMAYRPGEVVYIFSDPNRTHDGFRTGHGMANNSLTVMQTAPIVRNYMESRGRVVWVDFGQVADWEYGTHSLPYNTVAEAVGAMSPGETLIFKPGSTREHLTIDKSMTLEVYGDGSAIIGSER